MKALFDDLKEKQKRGTLSAQESVLLKKFVWATLRLGDDPRYPGLRSHEIEDLTARFSKELSKSCKVWQSYLENNTPGAGRIYWVYGPGQRDITIVGLEPHPEDKKKSGYTRVQLSKMENEHPGNVRQAPTQTSGKKGGKKRKT